MPKPMAAGYIPYFCSVGGSVAFGRPVMEAAYRAMLYAGLGIFGSNAEANPGQWEWQTKPLPGLQVRASFAARPLPYGEWCANGLHLNYSTKQMRADGGYKYVEEAVLKLEKAHAEHMPLYDLNGGQDNRLRMNGELGTSNYDEFTWGVGNKEKSVRIPNNVALEQKGYLEDRRPTGDCDPYDAIAVFTRTLCT